MPSKFCSDCWSKRGTILEIVLLVCGAGLAGFVLVCNLLAASAERKGLIISSRVLAAQQAYLAVPQSDNGGTGKESIIPEGSFGATYRSDSDGKEHPSQVIGQIIIPTLGLTVPIISGITNSDLLRGVGHVQGTAYAGGLGNMALAGHRDTFFRPLRRIAPGMLILASSSSGTYRYLVDRTEIVTPEQLRILDIGDHPQLTLITCFPFNYIGAAPSRFIVFAHLVSAAQDEMKR